jgi:hypothetical protein
MCHHRGTYGRVAIFETLVVTDSIRALIAERPFDLEARIRHAAIRSGMRPLRRCGLDLVSQGVVSLQQVADATPYTPDDALRIVWSGMEAETALAESIARRQPPPPDAPCHDGPTGRDAATFYCGPSTIDGDDDDTIDVIRGLIENARRDAEAGISVFSTIDDDGYRS